MLRLIRACSSPDIKRVLEGLGFVVEMPRTGSHFKAMKDGHMYPIPAHNGLKSEIDDRYIRGLCRKFDLDFDAFKSNL